MKIPRDLKPGDRLWYSQTRYTTVTPMDGEGSPYSRTGSVRAVDDYRGVMYYDGHGVECHDDTPPIIRIERIASTKPGKTKMDKDAAWLLKNGMARSHIHVSNSYFDGRIRAIAKRLNGGAL